MSRLSLKSGKDNLNGGKDRLNNGNNKKSSLYLITWAVLLSASLVIFVYGFFSYSKQRDQLITGIQGQTYESAQRLALIIPPFIESYQVYEYEKLVSHEIGTPNHYALSAIIVEDYLTGQITGERLYQTGWLREDDQVRRYRVENPADQALIMAAFYQATLPIKGASGQEIGQIRVFANDRSLKVKSRELLLDIIITALFLLLVLSLTLIVLLNRIFIRPLHKLSAAVLDQGFAGIPQDFTIDSPYKETALLSAAIQDMLYQIASTQSELAREHRTLENIVEGTGVGTWSWQIPTGKTEFNARWAEIVGYKLRELKPHNIDTWFSLLHPEDRLRSEKRLQRHFSGESAYYECEVRMRHKQGHWVWVLDRGKVMTRTEQGEPLEMFGTHMEITEMKRKAQQLELAASVYKQVHEGIMVVSASGVIIDINDAFSRITGYAYREVVGQKPGILRSGEHEEAFYQNFWRALEEKGHWSGEIWNRRKNGEKFPALMSVSRVADGEEDTHYVALLSDISEMKAYEQQLKHIAHYDVLTGLPNRLLLFDRLEQAIKQTRRDSQYGLAVAFIDLDGFKAVNDTYGHDAGDHLLIELAKKLSGVLREGDTLARLGGDEFVAVLTGVNSEQQALPVLNRMLRAAEQPVFYMQQESIGQQAAGQKVKLQGIPCPAEHRRSSDKPSTPSNSTERASSGNAENLSQVELSDSFQADITSLSRLEVTASIGVALLSGRAGVSVDQLVRQADHAMYQAKLKGKNSIYFSPVSDSNKDKQTAS